MNKCIAQELPFVQALRPRVRSADLQLGALLAEALQEALRLDLPSARRHCLAAFAAVGDTARAEQVACLASCSCTVVDVQYSSMIRLATELWHSMTAPTAQYITAMEASNSCKHATFTLHLVLTAAWLCYIATLNACLCLIRGIQGQHPKEGARLSGVKAAPDTECVVVLQVVRQVLVAPAVQEALSSAAGKRQPGVVAGSEGLQAVLPSILDAALARSIPRMRALRRFLIIIMISFWKRVMRCLCLSRNPAEAEQKQTFAWFDQDECWPSLPEASSR